MRVQPDHWSLLLDFCEKHPQIITNRFMGPNGKAELDNLWRELSIMLNALGHGEKTIIEWKKALIDWKSKTKGKAGAINVHQNKTGGGEYTPLVLSLNEERLLKIMGRTAVEGNTSVPEIGLRKRKIEESVAVSDESGIFVQLQGPSTSGTKISIPMNKMVPVTADILKENTIEKASTPTSRNWSHSPKKRKLEDLLLHENNKVLEVLQNINKNIEGINKNFAELVNLLKKQ